MNLPGLVLIEQIHSMDFIPIETMPYPLGKDFLGVALNEHKELLKMDHCNVVEGDQASAGLEWITHWFPAPISN